jgi:hypothetical protein
VENLSSLEYKLLNKKGERRKEKEEEEKKKRKRRRRFETGHANVSKEEQLVFQPFQDR